MRNFGEIDGVAVVITDHALTRMVEMKVTPEEFRALITEPDETYRSKKYPEATCHRKGRYSIATTNRDGELVIITILYSTLEDWVEAARDGELTDRSLRPGLNIPRWKKTRE